MGEELRAFRIYMTMSTYLSWDVSTTMRTNLSFLYQRIFLRMVHDISSLVLEAARRLLYKNSERGSYRISTDRSKGGVGPSVVLRGDNVCQAKQCGEPHDRRNFGQGL